MKKNLYYEHVYSRKNVIKEFFYSLFLGLSSWPRMFLEVFIRKNFGERYFSFSTAVIITVLAFFYPHINANMMATMDRSFNMYGAYGSVSVENTGFWHVMFKNTTWYLYLAAFFYMCLQRRNEVKRLPSVFDFARFSLSTGEVHPKFREIKIGGELATIRTISTLLEPALFFAVGMVLALLGQLIGGILVICSIIYSISYFAAYHIGDNFIMDKIDEMICNEELVASFVEERDPRQTRGFDAASARKPADPNLRRKVVDSFFADEDEAVEAK